MKDHKTLKYHRISIFLLFILLCGCSNPQKEDEDIIETDDGFKPVIMYQDNLYWLSVDRPLTELPEGFVDSQQKIKGCADDAMQLPKENLTTSAKGCGVLGKNILVNEADDSRIMIPLGSEKYEVYEKNQ